MKCINYSKDIPDCLSQFNFNCKKVFFFLKEKPPMLPKIKSNGLDENTLLKKNYSFDGLKKRLELNKEKFPSNLSKKVKT